MYDNPVYGASEKQVRRNRLKKYLWIVVLILSLCISLIVGYKVVERYMNKKEIVPIESSQPVEKIEPRRIIRSKIDINQEEEGFYLHEEITKEPEDIVPEEKPKKTTKKDETKPKSSSKKEETVHEEPSLIVEESSVIEEEAEDKQESSVVEEEPSKVEEKTQMTLEEKKKYWESINPPPTGKHLTKRGGVFQGASGKETYYNLKMTGVLKNIVYGTSWKGSLGLDPEEYPYWVRSDGAKMVGQYIMCAANLDIRPYGTILDTSLGKAIVVDTGTFAKKNPTQVDIAVNW